ncbi:MAG: isoaspartyl peptidase/L-asparaginase family protein [Vicinamibacterales bacterium]
MRTVTLLAACLLAAACQTPPDETPVTPDGPRPVARIEWGMVMHGGAGTILRERMSAEVEQQYRAALTEALQAGHRALADGGSGLDAVVAAITILEDSPLFNAGRGAVFTADGVNSLDASIMDGASLRAGAVAGVTDVKNPIALARLVMEKSPHVMLSGAGAEQFAREQGIPSTPKEWFYTERRWQDLQNAKADEKFGTVGAIALDRTGGLTAGTSTGGMTNKKWGRIGDSPIIGAGTYASARCAVSGTGWGEFFIRNAVASDICARMEYGGAPLADATDAVIMRKLPQQEQDTGGVIAMDRDGNIATPFNTAGMYRGWIDPDGRVTIHIFREP